MDYSELMSLSPSDFFSYVQSNIRYGYCDKNGSLHFSGDDDFPEYEYSYSPPETVVSNNCGWCWDVCQLTKDYCRHNSLECATVYFEYFDKQKGFHQTHTQCYMKIGSEWFDCPDNSTKEKFGKTKSDSLQKLISDFSSLFFEYCRKNFGELSENNKLVKFFDIEFERGISDEQFMSQIHNYKQQ